MTTAPTDESASISLKAARISLTISGDSALRRLGSSRVTSATPRSIEVLTRARALLVLDDSGGVLEEVLHLALVFVRGVAVAHRLLEAARTGEAVDGACGGIAVLEAGALQAAIVDTAAVADEVEHLRWELDAEAAERLSGQARQHGRERPGALAADLGHL